VSIDCPAMQEYHFFLALIFRYIPRVDASSVSKNLLIVFRCTTGILCRLIQAQSFVVNATPSPEIETQYHFRASHCERGFESMSPLLRMSLSGDLKPLLV
jgi:hypothetical protein